MQQRVAFRPIASLAFLPSSIPPLRSNSTIAYAFFLAVLCSDQGHAEEPSWEQLQNIPLWASAVLGSAPFSDPYVFSNRLNPFLLQGDFNGDSRLDLAILVQQKKSGAAGLVVIHAGASGFHVIGAGTAVGNGGDDFSWMNAWNVFSKSPVPLGADSSSVPELRGDALRVQKLESASGIIYWDGSSYQWYQQGD